MTSEEANAKITKNHEDVMSLTEASKQLSEDRRLLREFATAQGPLMRDAPMEWLEDHYRVFQGPSGPCIAARGEPFRRNGVNPKGVVSDEHGVHKPAIDGHRPDSNPKSALGIKKPPLHLVSPIAILHEAMAMAEGGCKYGPYNYREDAVAATVYIAACLRHVFEWSQGSDKTKDSKLHPLAHARACLGIIIDAEANGTLIDDRYKSEAYAKLAEECEAWLPEMAERVAGLADDGMLEAYNRLEEK